jgi:hypothetical protein
MKNIIHKSAILAAVTILASVSQAVFALPAINHQINDQQSYTITNISDKCECIDTIGGTKGNSIVCTKKSTSSGDKMDIGYVKDSIFMPVSSLNIEESGSEKTSRDAKRTVF